MKSSNIRLATPLTLRELIHMLLRSYTWKKDNSSFEENFSGQKPAAISTPKKKEKQHWGCCGRRRVNRDRAHMDVLQVQGCLKNQALKLAWNYWLCIELVAVAKSAHPLPKICISKRTTRGFGLWIWSDEMACWTPNYRVNWRDVSAQLRHRQLLLFITSPPCPVA